jgi:phage terminase large subunit
MTKLQNQVEINLVKEFEEVKNPKWRNIILYGGRYSGKSYSVALTLLLRGREKRLRILCTREVQNTIRDSVHKLLKDQIMTYGFSDYHVFNDSIMNVITGTEFIFKGLRANINEIKSTEGVDICWVEEAQAVSDNSWDILTPTIRKEGSQIIATFNRINELDPVYVRYVMKNPPNTYVNKVNYDVLEREGLLTQVIRDEMEADREATELFAHKWLGEPIGQGEMAIINRSACLEAMQRTVEDDGAKEVGVDVARMGGDRTVFFMRKGLKTVKFEKHQQLRTTQTCDVLERFVNEDKTIALKIDDTGVGGGVTDEMKKRGYNIIAINFGGVPSDNNKYPNWISEAWFHLAEIINEVQLPYDSDLLMELTTRQWQQDNKGKRKIESKVDYKKRGFRSPDIADACIICFGKPANLNKAKIIF